MSARGPAGGCLGCDLLPRGQGPSEGTRVDLDNLALYRFDGEWVALEAIRVGEDESHVYFEAETPAFSHFGIAGGAAPPLAVAPFPIVIVLGVIAAVIAISLAVLLWRKKRFGAQIGF